MFGKSRLTALFLGLAVPFCALAQAPKPVVVAIVNAASYATGPIAPGEMVIIFGSAFGPAQLVNLQLDPQGKIATTLAGVQVLFDGVAAPLIYVSPSQIAAMVPYNISGKADTEVQVVRAGLSSVTLLTPVAITAPGIFSADASGKGQAAITNSDGSINSLTNPAAPGSYITMYLTGEGRTDPPGSNGMIATGIANVQAKVSVRIAGQNAQFLYAGSAPGNVNGFAQINVVIPVDLAYGGSLPLLVQIGEAFTQAEITVAVSGPLAPVLNPPTGLTLSATSTNQIRVTWISTDALATRFHIERQTGGFGPFTEVAIVAAPAIQFNDSNIAPGTDYQYRIRAESDYGYSQYSAVTRISVPAFQLSPPANLQASAITPNLVIVTWNSANTNASSLLMERRTGANGAYALITTLSNSATSYQDPAVSANTTYTYRMRSQTNSNLSGYSSEIAVTTPGAPLPPAPNLSATAISASQIRLSWTSTTTGVVRFRIERRTLAGQYSEISQLGPSVTSFDDSGLSASTGYFYRMRVETGAGISAYSNEVTGTTMLGVPSAPSNLRATATSSTQVSLTWNNNAPDATAIRVESRSATISTFSDVGPAASLVSTAIINNQPNTSYTFRVRAQNGSGYSTYSNEVMVTTLPSPITVVLIHGIGQSGGALEPLARTLRLLPSQRFAILADFDWGRCANPSKLSSCDSDCTIETGANELRDYLNRKVPSGDIVLVGYSMGGLIARQLLLTTQFNRNRPIALVTLGTPNLGYPYSSIDDISNCRSLGQQMAGNFRANGGSGDFSPYLLNMNSTWASLSVAPAMGRWLAISATSCRIAARLNGSGCPDSNVLSDGVVCDVSARLLFQYRFRPSEDFFTSNFFHSAPRLGALCDNPPSGTVLLPALYNAGKDSDVGQRLMVFLNGL